MEEEIITIEEDGEEVVVTLEEDILYCNDYDLLKNLPTINTIEVKGDKTGADYGLVDAEVGKGLSANDFTDDFETKLTGIEAGAEVNNISDTNATDLTDGGATTLHKHSYNNLDDKPTIPSITGLAEQTQLPYFQVKSTIDATLLLGTIYRLGTLSGNLSFALPDPTTTVLQEIALVFNLDSNLRTLTITGTNFYPSTLTLVVNLGYVIRLVSDGTKWVVGKRSFVKA